MLKLNALLIALNLLIAPFSGWLRDSYEIDDQTYVVNMAVDVGEKEALLVTVQLPSYGGGASGGNTSGSGGGGGEREQGAPGYEVVKAESSSLMGCLDLINIAVPRRVDYMQTRQIIISEELARGDQFPAVVNDLMLLEALRRRAYVVIAKDDAAAFVEGQGIYIGTYLSKTVDSALTSYGHSGYVVPITLAGFLADYYGESHDAAAIYAALRQEGSLEKAPPSTFSQLGDAGAGELAIEGKYKPEYFGVALFDDTKMVEQITGYQAQLLNIVRHEPTFGMFQLERSDGPPVQMTLHKESDPKIEVDLSAEPIRVRAEFYLEGDLHQRVRPEQAPRFADELEASFERDILDLLQSAREKGADPGYFGERALRQFLSWQDWEDYGWMRRFATAEIDIRVNVLLHEQDFTVKSPT